MQRIPSPFLALPALLLLVLSLAPPLRGAVPQQGPEILGRWEDPFDLSPVFRAAHASLIPVGPYRGQILAWGSQKPTNQGMDWAVRWFIVDPPSSSSTEMGFLIRKRDNLGDLNEGSIWCSGHTWTADGRLFVAGGTKVHGNSGDPNAPIGANLCLLFDPNNVGNGEWIRLDSMLLDRWYPSVLLLGNAQPLVFGGVIISPENAPKVIAEEYEAFDPATGTWQINPQTGTQLFPGLSGNGCETLYSYPRIHLIPEGSAFVSSYTGHSVALADHEVSPGVWEDFDHAFFHVRFANGSVLRPLDASDPNEEGEVWILGGDARADKCLGSGGTPTEIVESISFAAAGPTWSLSPPDLPAARSHFNTTLLPDGSIFVVGGLDENADAVYLPELYSNGTWTTMAPETSPRDHHATSLLLPDGRVLVGGGNDRTTDFRVFEPPYLFSSTPRPVIAGYTTADTLLMSYSPAGGPPNTYELDYTGTAATAVLARPGSNTHHFDFDQRIVILGGTFDDPTGKAWIDAPSNENLAPPGYYMLFFLTSDGVPSEAIWVHLS